LTDQHKRLGVSVMMMAAVTTTAQQRVQTHAVCCWA
jgi:hypothetical protein